MINYFQNKYNLYVDFCERSIAAKACLRTHKLGAVGIGLKKIRNLTSFEKS